jgi:hypothetical protein
MLTVAIPAIGPKQHQLAHKTNLPHPGAMIRVSVRPTYLQPLYRHPDEWPAGKRRPRGIEAHRSQPALPRAPSRAANLGTSQGFPRLSGSGLRAVVRACTMWGEFAVKVICYSYYRDGEAPDQTATAAWAFLVEFAALTVWLPCVGALSGCTVPCLQESWRVHDQCAHSPLVR